jgi:large subunit ribosomal protein L25
VDVEGMKVGTAVHARDLDLPAGSSLQTDPDALVLHVLEPAAEVAAEEAEAARGEAQVPAPVEAAE